MKTTRLLLLVAASISLGACQYLIPQPAPIPAALLQGHAEAAAAMMK